MGTTENIRRKKSKGHILIGELLSFCNFKYAEEVPVSKINPNSTLRGWFDWVILDLKCVIEVHGRQHYEAVDFSGKDAEGAVMKYNEQKLQDAAKQRAAAEGGWGYLAIPYIALKDLSEEDLFVMVKEAVDLIAAPCSEWQASLPPACEEYKEFQKQRAKKYRKEQYLRQKALKKKWEAERVDQG